jgi:F-box-like
MSSELITEIESIESCSSEILPYAYNIVYLRQYCTVWREYMRQVQAFLDENVKYSSKVKCVRAVDVLPYETLLLITSFCDAKTLCRASAASVTWNAMCSRYDLWENLCRRQFFISTSQFVAGRAKDVDDENIDSKELYKAALSVLQGVLRGGSATKANMSAFTGRNVPVIQYPILIR